MKEFDPPDWIKAKYDVSRETCQRISFFLSHLHQWSQRTNLIGPSEWPHIWERHIDDSLFLLSHLPMNARILDIGSGGGFPSIPVICALDQASSNSHILIEASSKKCAFLRSVIGELNLPAKIINDRIENVIDNIYPEYITARALASLPDLIELCKTHLSNRSIALFHKGENINNELTQAYESWAFEYELHQQNDKASIVEIKNLRPR